MSALDVFPYDYETPVIVDAERPTYGLNWPSIQTLRYRASLIEVRTGVRCKVVQVYEHNPVDDSERESPRPATPDETFEVCTEHANAGPLEYKVALAWMDAFEEGINEYRWIYSADPRNS
jgi:hypothetical protein